MHNIRNSFLTLYSIAVYKSYITNFILMNFLYNNDERCCQFNFYFTLDKDISFTIGTATPWCLPSLAEATVHPTYLNSRGVHSLEVPYTWKAFGDKKGQWLMIIIGEKHQKRHKELHFGSKNPLHVHVHVHVCNYIKSCLVI